jgi:hypothetical protein
MLSGFEGTLVKYDLRKLGFQIVDVNRDISMVNDTITSISEILTGLEGTHVKDYLRELGFQINDFRDDNNERMTVCERKIEEHDNKLFDILSRLIVAGI